VRAVEHALYAHALSSGPEQNPVVPVHRHSDPGAELAPARIHRGLLVDQCAMSEYFVDEGNRAIGIILRDVVGDVFQVAIGARRKNEGHQLADVMRPRAPGADFFYGPHGAQYVGAMRCGGGASTVYLDGVPLSGDPGPMIMVQGKTRITTTPPDLSQIPVEMLGGVEWYPSTDFAPIEFGGTTKGCGVLLLWTRER